MSIWRELPKTYCGVHTPDGHGAGNPPIFSVRSTTVLRILGCIVARSWRLGATANNANAAKTANTSVWIWDFIMFFSCF
jgi:hypothetical protein